MKREDPVSNSTARHTAARESLPHQMSAHALGISGLASAALSWSLFLFFFVNRNRIQILRLEDLVAIQAADVVHTIAPVEKFSSLVLTSLHSEISPILD
jgi:hypothetical protein